MRTFNTWSSGRTGPSTYQNLSEVFIRDIGELCSVVLGNDKGVAFAERSNVKEGKSLRALEELEARDITYP
jgi:hypothetical protein